MLAMRHITNHRILFGVNCFLLLLTLEGSYGNVFERTVSRVPARLLDSRIMIQQPPPNAASHEDRFHISRVERVRYGKTFRRRANLPQSEQCKYKKEPWGDCEASSSTQRRRFVLKKGNPACEPTKEITRPCRVAKAAQAADGHRPKAVVCRYKKGTWSECDARTGLKSRTDTLKLSKQSQNPAMIQQLRDNCEATRVMTRKCRATKLGCKYNRTAAWSDCDARTNLRTKILKLEGGAGRSGSDCEPERRITKNCWPGQYDRMKRTDGNVEEDEEEQTAETLPTEEGSRR